MLPFARLPRRLPIARARCGVRQTPELAAPCINYFVVNAALCVSDWRALCRDSAEGAQSVLYTARLVRRC